MVFDTDHNPHKDGDADGMGAMRGMVIFIFVMGVLAGLGYYFLQGVKIF